MLTFKKITIEDMPLIWDYLRREPGRTTDFSYGGVIMWVEWFHYEYCIYRDTLFIRGRVEDCRTKSAFSLPIGSLPLAEGIRELRDFCSRRDIMLEFSAIPEYALPEFEALGPSYVQELESWGDYLYDAHPLATLGGKKMAKKRNHVNRFLSEHPEAHLVELTADNLEEAYALMDRYDPEGDNTKAAAAERAMTRLLISLIPESEGHLLGALLAINEGPVALTIGDLKGDTLFIHVEKALREYSGSFETINTLFARRVIEHHPEVHFINREDDAGDEGLRRSKLSYHPVEILRKYNILF